MQVRIIGRAQSGPVDLNGDLPEDLKQGDSFLLAEGEENRVIITEKSQRFTQGGTEETVLTVERWTKPGT
jgi:hypothetical protein